MGVFDCLVILFVGGLIYGVFWAVKHFGYVDELVNKINKIKEKIASIFKREIK